MDRLDGHAALELLDWKRRVFELYARVRAAPDPRGGWHDWRRERDRLFRDHPRSPLPAPGRSSFKGLAYFDHDPTARVVGELRLAEAVRYEIPTSGGETYAFTRIARVAFELHGEAAELELYWLEGYGGGLFLPFRDTTSGIDTYGGGRYLLDTVKGADLGADAGGLVLDFNFAYNPSCSYDPRWVCPLASPANRLKMAVRAGERTT
ncbi:MAG: DUF1684 domain-containing protein [Actinomycetota bacterium]